MVTTFELYNDRDLIKSLPVSLQGELLRHRLIPEKEKGRISFCGMVLTDSGVAVFLPRSVRTQQRSASRKVGLAAELMKAVSLYSRRSSTGQHAYDAEEGRVGTVQLGAVMRLLEDYCSWGLYSKRTRVSVLNSGKPDWKKTISNSAAYPSASGAPVYLDVWGNKSRYVSDCEVARIHASVIRSLDRRYSWMITGKDGVLDPALRDIPAPAGDINYQVSVLEKELQQVYSDREIWLLNALINYLRKYTGKKRSGQVIGLRKFHFAWEHMLNQVMEHTFSVSDVLPVPAYLNHAGDLLKMEQKGQRTDITLRHPSESIVAVVDAKYYNAQTPGGLPGWHDLVKQFFYAKALAEVYGSGFEIKNAFIFPGKCGPYRSAHMSKKGAEEALDKEYTPVECLYVCPAEVIHHYVNGKVMLGVSDQILVDAPVVLPCEETAG